MFFNVLGKMFIDIGGSPEATKTTAKCLFCNKNLLCSTSIRKAPEEARGNFNERTCNCKQSITQRIIYGRLIGDDLSWSNLSKGLSGDEEVLCLSTILKLVRWWGSSAASSAHWGLLLKHLNSSPQCRHHQTLARFNSHQTQASRKQLQIKVRGKGWGRSSDLPDASSDASVLTLADISGLLLLSCHQTVILNILSR